MACCTTHPAGNLKFPWWFVAQEVWDGNWVLNIHRDSNHTSSPYLVLLQCVLYPWTAVKVLHIQHAFYSGHHFRRIFDLRVMCGLKDREGMMQVPRYPLLASLWQRHRLFPSSAYRCLSADSQVGRRSDRCDRDACRGVVSFEPRVSHDIQSADKTR